MTSATIRELTPGTVYIYTPYNSAFLAAFKAVIPGADRRWDPDARVWQVAANHVPALVDLCRRHGMSVDAPALTTAAAAPTPTIQVLRVSYIGAPKEREDGSFSAYGNSDGEWKLVFPQAVLQAWFNDGDASPAAAVTFYGLLAVKRTATEADIKTAYRKLAKRWHPDVNRDPDATTMFQQLGRAYEVLSDPQQRRRYDAGLQLETSVTGRQTRTLTTDYWRPPLRCGWLSMSGFWRVGRFHVQEILGWQDITDATGRTLVTAWPMGADTFEEIWV